MNYRVLLFIFLILVTFLRIGLVALQSPSPEEAYYFLCSQRLDWGFFDGPPGLAVCTRGLWDLTGENFSAVREISPFLALAVSLAAFALVRAIYSNLIASWVVATLNMLPIFNLLSTQLNPLLPSLFASILGLFFAWHALESERNKIGRWFLTGLSFAVAIIFRYEAILPFFGFILLVALSHRYRKKTACIGLCIVFLFILLVLSGPLWWNAKQAWLPIASGTLQTVWQLKFAGFFISLNSFFVACSPVIGVALLVSIFLAANNARHHIRARFLFASIIVPAVWWGYLALRELDDPSLFLFGAPLLLAYLFAEADKTISKGVIAIVGIAWIVAVFLSASLLFQSLNQGIGWRELSEQIVKDKNSLTPSLGEPFLIAQNVPMASILGFHLESPKAVKELRPPVFIRESQDISNQFMLWPGYGDFVMSQKSADPYFTEQQGINPYLGRSALYISEEKPDDLPQSIHSAFENVSLLHKTELTLGGMGHRVFYFYLCLNYQTMPL